MKAFKSIVTPRTKIRRLLPTDKENLAELLCDGQVTDNMAFTDEMKTVAGAAGLLEMTLKLYDSETPLLAYAIEDKNNTEFLGVTGLNPWENGEVEIFYAFLPKNWGKGLATEVMHGLTHFIFESEEASVVTALITQNNLASIKVAEKNGFSSHGLIENPSYRDLVFLYKKEKAEHNNRL